MTGTIRFHLNENIDSAIAEGLRRRGVEVTTPNDVGLLGASDDEHLAFAFREKRAIVTHDEDFLAIANRRTEHCGIFYCHPGSRSVGQILSSLLLFHDCLSDDQMRNHVEFL